MYRPLYFYNLVTKLGGENWEFDDRQFARLFTPYDGENNWQDTKNKMIRCVLAQSSQFGVGLFLKGCVGVFCFHFGCAIGTTCRQTCF